MKKTKIKDKIIDLKKRYDKTRTTYEISKANKKQCVKEMKKYGVTPDTIDDAITKLKEDIKKKEKNINKALVKINESLEKIKQD